MKINIECSDMSLVMAKPSAVYSPRKHPPIYHCWSNIVAGIIGVIPGSNGLDNSPG
ncbi:MAG: hypothetical protein LBG22_09510 [Treponema sp.]|nr:hypothetical protein [Treponema sp.]